MLRLRPMTSEEFDTYLAQTIEDYAKERSDNLGTPLEQERETAREQITDLLDDGLDTDDHHIWVLEHPVDGNIGHLWVHVSDDRQHAFIFDIAVEASQRGRGYGKRMLELLDEELRTMGVRRVGLNVFSKNDVALKLYQKHGFYITNYNMQKDL